MANTAKPVALPISAAEPTSSATIAVQTGQAIGFAKSRVEEMSTKSREAMEMGLKSVDAVATMSRGNVDAIVEASRVAAGAFEAISKEVADYSKQRVERTTSAARAMTQAQSLPELLQLQGDFARAEFAAAIAETTRLSQTVFATLGAIFEPLQQQAMAAAQSKDAPKNR